MGYIYKITNKITNEIYVGQTTGNIEIRFKEHIREAFDALDGKRQSFPYFHRMIIKYGVENFYITKLEECDNESLNEREQYWVEYYNSFNNGYNSNTGGRQCVKSHNGVSQFTVDKIYIKTFSSVKEAADAVGVHPSNIRKNCNNQSSNCGGFLWQWGGNTLFSRETKSCACQGHTRRVGKFNLNNELISQYESISGASKENKINYMGIYQCCTGKHKTAGGFIWKYL